MTKLVFLLQGKSFRVVTAACWLTVHSYSVCACCHCLACSHLVLHAFEHFCFPHFSILQPEAIVDVAENGFERTEGY